MTEANKTDNASGEKSWGLGDRLRVSRCSARLTIRDMGQRLGVTNEVVNGYEREATPIPENIVATYSELTGVDVDWIRTGAGAAPPLHGDVT